MRVVMSPGQAAFPAAPFLDGFPGLERCLMHTRSKDTSDGTVHDYERNVERR